MDEVVYAKQGSVTVRGYSVWYGIVGTEDQPGKAPLVVLHGGPFLPHDYLEPIGALARGGRRVIFYDQIGCGNSDRPTDASVYSIDLWLEELTALREHLGLDRVHLLAHSMGGVTATEYALRRPAGLVSVTLSDSIPAAQKAYAEGARLRRELPAEVYATMSKHEAAGTINDPEYQQLFHQHFYRGHVCRVEPPPCVARSFPKMGSEGYSVMYGPSWFVMTGKIKDWDVTSRLGQINVPTLVLVGRYDQATPALSQTFHENIAGSELVVFENSSHLPFIEEHDRYVQVVDDFLRRAETR